MFIFTYPFVMNIILVFSLFNALGYLIVFYGITLPVLWLGTVWNGMNYNFGDGSKMVFYYEPKE